MSASRLQRRRRGRRGSARSGSATGRAPCAPRRRARAAPAAGRREDHDPLDDLDVPGLVVGDVGERQPAYARGTSPAGPPRRCPRGRRCRRAWLAQRDGGVTVCPSLPTTTTSPWKRSRRWASAGAISTCISGRRKCRAGDTRPRGRSRSSGTSRGAGARWGGCGRGHVAAAPPAEGSALGRAGGGTRPGVAGLPAHAPAADLVERHAGVAGHGFVELRGRHRRGEDAEVDAQRLGELGQPYQPRECPGQAVAGRSRWIRPSGCVTVPSRLGVGLGRKDDRRVLADAVGQERGVGDHRRRAVEPLGSQGRLGRRRRAAGRLAAGVDDQGVVRRRGRSGGVSATSRSPRPLAGARALRAGQHRRGRAGRAAARR